MKHKILLAILCMAFLIMLVPPASAPAAQSSEEVRLGLIYPLNQIDPLFVENSSEAFLVEQQFLGLVRLDENENLLPELAQSWEVSDDGLTWTFNLRPGISWVKSNLEPIRDVTAEDVSFTIFRALDSGNFEEIVQSVEAVDDYTVQFFLRAPDPGFLTALAMSPAAKIVPSNLVQEAGDAWTEPDAIWGTGSYLIVDRTDSSARLEPNPFWEGENNILARSVQIEFTPNYEEALQRYLRSEFDMIEIPPEIGEIMFQEPGLKDQVRFAESMRFDLFSQTITPSLEQIQPRIEHSYLVKPYILPVFSGYSGLDRFIHWGFDTQPPEVEIPGTTRVLNAETLSALQSMSEDQSRLVFERMTPQLSLIFVDDIIVGGSTLDVGNYAAPFGFLRRVVNTYSESSGEFVIETIPAALDEAIQNGGQSQQVPVDFDAIYEEELLNGSALNRGDGIVPIGYTPPYAELRITFDHVVYDDDGDTTTTDDQVKARGWVSVEPGAEVQLDFDIRNYQLQYFNFVTISKESARVELFSKVNLLSFDERVPIAHYTFMPITFFIGYVPVVITPELTVYVGANGKVSIELNTGVDQSATIVTGAKYENGNWQTIKQISDSSLSKIETVLKQSASVQAYAGPELAVKVYGAAGPYGRIRGHLTLSADPSATPWWTLKGGVKGEVGIKVELFSHVVASYTIPITLIEDTVLDQAGVVVPTLTNIPPAPTPTPPQNGSTNTCSSIWWPPGCWPWWLWVIAVILVLFILVMIF